jgi:hypothetical protein
LGSVSGSKVCGAGGGIHATIASVVGNEGRV